MISVLAFELTLNRGTLILSLNSNVNALLIVGLSSPDESLYVIDYKLIVLAVIVPVQAEVDVISKFFTLINPSVV